MSTVYVTMTVIVDNVPDEQTEEDVLHLVQDNLSMFSKAAFWSTEKVTNESKDVQTQSH